MARNAAHAHAFSTAVHATGAETALPQVLLSSDVFDKVSSNGLCHHRIFRTPERSCCLMYQIVALLIVNSILMALEHNGSSPAFSTMLDYTNLAFTCVFTLEAVMKLLALSKELCNHFLCLCVLRSHRRCSHRPSKHSQLLS